MRDIGRVCLSVCVHVCDWCVALAWRSVAAICTGAEAGWRGREGGRVFREKERRRKCVWECVCEAVCVYVRE